MAVSVRRGAASVYGSTAQGGQPGGDLPASQRMLAGWERLWGCASAAAVGAAGLGSYRSRLGFVTASGMGLLGSDARKPLPALDGLARNTCSASGACCLSSGQSAAKWSRPCVLSCGQMEHSGRV